MPVFAIWREFKAMTKAEEETLRMLAIAGTRWLPGVRWVRSFGMDLDSERPRTVCIYEGPTLDSVVEHSRCCALPLTSVSQVTAYANHDLHHYGESAIGPLVLVTRNAAGAESNFGDGDAIWLRSFEASERSVTLSLFSGSDAEAVARFADLRPGDSIEAVVESVPADVAHLYDSLGLPRHWEEAHAPVSDR